MIFINNENNELLKDITSFTAHYFYAISLVVYNILII